jgi:hypothetical protein
VTSCSPAYDLQDGIPDSDFDWTRTQVRPNIELGVALASRESAAAAHSQPLDSVALASGPAKSPAAGDVPRSGPRTSAKLLFASGFEEGVALSAPRDGGGWQHLSGTDSATGFAWPPNVWGGGAALQLLTGVGVDDASVSTYIVNRIETVIGRTGAPIRALYQSIVRTGTGVTQDPLLFTPSAAIAQEGDLYTSEWVKLQPDLALQLVPGKMADGSWGNWRVLFEWKTGGQGAYYGGDYRVMLSVNMSDDGKLYWSAVGDNNANGSHPFETYWAADNHMVPVVAGRWFRLETFTHRSTGADGEFWAKIDGQTVVDHVGPNVGVDSDPINRIMLSQVYTGGRMPAYQWVDDLEIWEGIPPSAAGNGRRARNCRPNTGAG